MPHSSATQQTAFCSWSCRSEQGKVSRKFAPTLAALEREWKSRGVQFLFTGAIPSDPPEALAALAAEHHFQGPCTADAPQALLCALDAKTTTEVFILDRARTLRYRGAVDDQYGIGYQKDQPSRSFLTEALHALSNGQRPRIEATSAPGCVLEIAPPPANPANATAAADSPTWHREISRIIQRNCQECHRPGGTGPFELTTLTDVTGHAGMITKVVTKGPCRRSQAGPLRHSSRGSQL